MLRLRHSEGGCRAGLGSAGSPMLPGAAAARAVKRRQAAKQRLTLGRVVARIATSLHAWRVQAPPLATARCAGAAEHTAHSCQRAHDEINAVGAQHHARACQASHWQCCRRRQLLHSTSTCCASEQKRESRRSAEHAGRTSSSNRAQNCWRRARLCEKACAPVQAGAVFLKEAQRQPFARRQPCHRQPMHAGHHQWAG